MRHRSPHTPSSANRSHPDAQPVQATHGSTSAAMAARPRVIATIAAALTLSSASSLIAQVGNPKITMGVVGDTAAFAVGDDSVPDDLTGRIFGGLLAGDWERRWSVASPQAIMPISWFVAEPGDTPFIDWRYGWGAINRLQSPIASGTWCPRGSGELTAPMCVAGASSHSTGLSAEPSYHLAQGVASTRTVFTIVSKNGKPLPPAPIPISVTLVQSTAIGDRWMTPDNGVVDGAAGGWFQIFGAGVSDPLIAEWAQFVSLEDAEPYPGSAPEVAWGNAEGLDGWDENDNYVLATNAVLPGASTNGRSRSHTLPITFTLQPSVHSKNIVKPSSVTFTAELHTAAEARVIAQRAIDGEPETQRSGGLEIAASAAFANWVLPAGCELAIVDDPTPVKKVGMQVIGGGAIKAGTKLTLWAHDGWGPASWTDLRAARLIRDLFLTTTFGHRPVGNSRTLFYRDVNGNGAIDSSDSLLGESHNTRSPSITITVKKAWGKSFKVIAVSENALGERGPRAVRTIKSKG